MFQIKRERAREINEEEQTRSIVYTSNANEEKNQFKENSFYAF